MLPPKGHRSKLTIIADVLRLLRLGQTGKTEIAVFAKIKPAQASKYVEELITAGVVEKAGEEMELPAYRITRRGLTLLNMIENLHEAAQQEETINILRYFKVEGFNTGQVLITRGVAQLSLEKPEFAAYVRKSLERYRQGDWGEINAQDKQLNEQSLEKNMRVFCSYESGAFPEIWIFTEPDRSYTFVMFPEEYASTVPLEHYQQADANSPKAGQAG